MRRDSIKLIKKSFQDKNIAENLIEIYKNRNIEDLRSMVTASHFCDFGDIEKKELIEFYTKYRDDNNIKNPRLRAIIFDIRISELFKYEELKKMLSYYVYDNSIYELMDFMMQKKKAGGEQIIKSSEDYIVRNLNSNREKYDKAYTNKDKIDYSQQLYIITSNPDIFKYRTKQDIDKLIYACADDENGILSNIVVNDGLLQYRNIEEQLKLMNLYLSMPYLRTSGLITDGDILKNHSLKEQVELISEYTKNISKKNNTQIQDEPKNKEEMER